MTVVKGLAHSGITVCATIHSPTPYAFALFDRLIILLHGHVAYAGASGVDIPSHVQCLLQPTTNSMQPGLNSI